MTADKYDIRLGQPRQHDRELATEIDQVLQGKPISSVLTVLLSAIGVGISGLCENDDAQFERLLDAMVKALRAGRAAEQARQATKQ